MRIMLAGACAALSALTASPAFAACTFKVLPLPVTMVGNKPTVPIRIQGQEYHFLIDSGASINVISAGVSEAQKLMAKDKRYGGRVVAYAQMSGVKGVRLSVPIVAVPEVEFLGVSLKDQAFAVSPLLLGVDGLLGQPMLHQMDVEYDLKANTIRLVQTDDCKGVDMTYWAKDGQQYSKIPRGFNDRYGGPTTGTILLNGQKMRAQFDTGASTSFITQAAAVRAGVKVTDPGVKPLGLGSGVDGFVNSWVGTFAEVKIGDEVIQNAPLTIGDSRAQDFDVLIGADFFLSHHVYVSNSQILFAYEGGPAFRTGAAPQAQGTPSRKP